MQKKIHQYAICPNCEYFCNIMENKNYCPGCGIKLLERCPDCSKPIENPYAKYCGFCGAEYKKNNNSSLLREIK